MAIENISRKSKTIVNWLALSLERMWIITEQIAQLTARFTHLYHTIAYVLVSVDHTHSIIVVISVWVVSMKLHYLNLH